VPTNYDAIADRYKRAKQQPWRSFVESFTLLNLIGELAGKSVVDLACGEGFYTRLIRHQGAARVLGVDLSEGMIELARAEEAAHHLGIEYEVQDCLDLKYDGVFDLAVAAYLLNYARCRDELEAMCRGIVRGLKPGGRFVTVNTNPAAAIPQLPSFGKYGFDVDLAGELREGAPITWTFHLDDGPVSIENYHLSIAAHEEALSAAGFKEIRWHRPQLSPLGEAAKGRDYWADFLAHPPVIFIECLKCRE
jgi:SAM-dependent methyltransferase